MSDGTEGSAVITTDQIYAELQKVSNTLTELKIRFEAVGRLEKRIDALEQELADRQKNNWQLPVAWTAAATGTFAAVYQAFGPH